MKISNMIITIDMNSSDIQRKLVNNNREYFGNFLSEIAMNNFLIFTTNDSLKDIYNLIKKWNISRGTIIACNGSIVYDIQSNNIILNKPINMDSLKYLVHFSTLTNALLQLKSINKTIIYSSDKWAKNDFKKFVSINEKTVSNYNNFIDYIGRKPFYSMELYSPNDDVNFNIKLNDVLSFFKEKTINYQNIGENLHIFNEYKCSKSSALKFVLKKIYPNQIIKSDIYVAFNDIDQNIVKNLSNQNLINKIFESNIEPNSNCFYIENDNGEKDSLPFLSFYLKVMKLLNME